MTVPGGEAPFTGLDGAEPLVDQRVRALLDRYVALSGAQLVTLAPDLQQLTVPASDRGSFARRSAIRLAFSADALREDEKAELAIVGSPFVAQLIAAVRRRGARLDHGRLSNAAAVAELSPPAPLPVSNGRVADTTTRLARHRLGRLTARIVTRAATQIKETLATSDVFDLCTGAAVGADIARACDADQVVDAVWDARWREIPVAPARQPAEFIRLMLASLERQLRPEVDALESQAQTRLVLELGRIDRYYSTLLEDVGGRGTEIPDSASRRAIQAEHQRRRREETERHQVRATVHPVQLAEWEVAVQRSDWVLESTTGHRGTFTAQRLLAGEQAWIVMCPTCGTSPGALSVCHTNHVACATCARRCSVCADIFCPEHGLAACHIDAAPACSNHARACACCQKPHCSAHEGVCAETGHATCVSCLSPCAHCGRIVCDQHAVSSDPDAPRGARRLCRECVRLCEGGTSEIVGPDEVTGCASCNRDVCERHQARCDVDTLVHCSKHLRRTDRSRRLVCERHRASCQHEQNTVFASDEVTTCSTCSWSICLAHAGVCTSDGLRHCNTHLLPLRDVPGKLACKDHRSICHIDDEVFSRKGTSACPSCNRLTCAEHRRICQNCGRRICVADFRTGATICGTCAQLADAEDLPNAILAAVGAATGSHGRKVKRWRSARDARHVVVELDLGWTRRLVLAIPHLGGRAESVVWHSLLGTRTVR